ncbi:MAG: hypothetical protein P9L88_00800 [Candidatus Tantalella remota]|nr:hypothetical protein [Candidatus Tantalella remota]
MTKKLVFLLLFVFFVCDLGFCVQDELHIVTDAPVALGGGLLRHYTDSANGPVFIRYSYKGLAPGCILVKKTTVNGAEDSTKTEILRLPLKNKKTAFRVGARDIQLNVTGRKRVTVKEKD